MQEITIVGLDLAKRVFQVHGANADGGVAFLQKLSRGQLLAFLQGCRAVSLPWGPARRPITGRGRSAALDIPSG